MRVFMIHQFRSVGVPTIADFLCCGLMVVVTEEGRGGEVYLLLIVGS